MSIPSPIREEFRPLAEAIFEGNTTACIGCAESLLAAQIPREQIVTEGLEKAMEALDEKCTVNQFNLLEIMLAGRGVNAVLGRLYPDGDSGEGGSRGMVVLAAMEGDVHDLGKNLVRTVLRTRGFRVLDLGKNVAVETLVETCKKEKPLAVGISGLLTLVVPQVKKVRTELRAAGLENILVLAGGAALKQGSPQSLNVDYVAESVFDGVSFLEHAAERLGSTGAPSIRPAKLTAMEKIALTLRFEKTEKPPVIAQLFGHTARLAGLTLREYRTNGGTVAECQLAARQSYGHDAVFAIMDLNVEAEALGAEMNDPPNSYADILRHPLAEAREVAGLALPNPEKDGRMPEILRACRRLRREVREELPVVGGCLGPVTLASQLLGLEKFLFAFHDSPEEMNALLDFCTSTSIAFGLAQLRVGAHLVLVIEPTCSPTVLPAEHFRRHAIPRLRRVFHEFARSKAIANWLMITGPILPILPDLPATGVNLVNIDYDVPAAAARSALPGMPLNGNIAPLAFVESNPSKIASDVHMLMETLQRAGGWILSAGCEIPPEAHPENIAAMIQALHGN